MKSVRRASLLFTVGSSIYWMLAAIVQYQGLWPIFDAPHEAAAWIIGIIGILPLAICSLICLFTFRWLYRKLTLVARAEVEKQPD